MQAITIFSLLNAEKPWFIDVGASHEHMCLPLLILRDIRQMNTESYKNIHIIDCSKCNLIIRRLGSLDMYMS